MKNKFIDLAKKFSITPKTRIPSYYEVLKAEWVFYINHIRPGMVVFDIGAYIGDLTWVFSQFAGRDGRVFAFEPSVVNFNKLKELCKLMDLGNVTCEQLAVCDVLGSIDFFTYGEHYDSWGSLAKRSIDEQSVGVKSGMQVEKVTSITLDEYCSRNQIESIDILKIDVEGSELQVLYGARRLFTEKRIKSCLFEFGGTTFEAGNSPEAIREFFNTVGYTIESVINDAPLFPVDSRNVAQFNMIAAKP